MTAIQAIILGIIQGITEFLPVSSSGHLLLAQKLLGLPSTGLLLEILLHAGTLVAVAAVFWQDLWRMLRNPFRDRTVRMLILASIPATVAALLLGDMLDALFEGWFLGFSFLITAGLLWGVEAIAARKPGPGTEEVDLKHALTMGLMQAVALLPGVSRSGATIVGGVGSGLTRRSAAKFSFLMSAIATLGSMLLKFNKLLDSSETVFQSGLAMPLLSVAVAAVSGYLAVRWMLALIQRISLRRFALYVAILGLLILCDQLFLGKYFPPFV